MRRPPAPRIVAMLCRSLTACLCRPWNTDVRVPPDKGSPLRKSFRARPAPQPKVISAPVLPHLLRAQTSVVSPSCASRARRPSACRFRRGRSPARPARSAVRRRSLWASPATKWRRTSGWMSRPRSSGRAASRSGPAWAKWSRRARRRWLRARSRPPRRTMSTRRQAARKARRPPLPRRRMSERPRSPGRRRLLSAAKARPGELWSVRHAAPSLGPDICADAVAV